MALCGNCGQQTMRLRQEFDSRTGGLVREYCVQCKPEEFADQAVTDPSDKKVYIGPDALPHMYRMGQDGILHAKDELLQDSLDILNADPDKDAREKAIAKKRATRRTEPLTPAEIRAAERWGREVLRPRLEGRV